MNQALSLSAKRKRRDDLYRKYQGRCYWCGCQTRICPDGPKDQATIDHVFPRWRGGQDTDGNCVLACQVCNSRRNSGDLIRIYKELEQKLAKYERQAEHLKKLKEELGRAHTITNQWMALATEMRKERNVLLVKLNYLKPRNERLEADLEEARVRIGIFAPVLAILTRLHATWKRYEMWVETNS